MATAAKLKVGDVVWLSTTTLRAPFIVQSVKENEFVGHMVGKDRDVIKTFARMAARREHILRLNPELSDDELQRQIAERVKQWGQYHSEPANYATFLPKLRETLGAA